MVYNNLNSFRLVGVLLLLLNVTYAFGTIKKVDYNSKPAVIKRHEVLDIVFRANTKTLKTKTFDVSFSGEFISPSGRKMVVPGFFNGNDEWVIRFSANEPGTWTYMTTSDLNGLKKKKGSIRVSEDTYKNRLGMVQVDKNNPKHFCWESKEPYFLMAFECDFLFALDYHQAKKERLNGFLDEVKQNGFNHIVMNVYANDVVWTKDSKLKNFPKYEFGGDKTIFPYLGNNEKPDYSSLNVDFFKNLDQTIEALNDRNIISHLMIYVWNKNVNWPEPGSDPDNMYFDYVLKRYQAFSNIVWDISKEAIFYGHVKDDYIVERIGRVRKIDAFKRLVTVHDFGFCNRNKNTIDFISHQDWSLNIYGDMLQNYRQFKDVPVFNIEHGGYEESDFTVFTGNYVNAEYCLRRNYECAFAGVYSTYYWQGCSWNVLAYDWQNDPLLKYRPKFEYFRYMTDFFNRFPFREFKPAPEMNSSGYCLINEKGTYLFYVPKETYKIAFYKLAKETKLVSFQWFNTHTGKYSEVVKSEVNKIQESPWYMKNDAILVITKVK